MQGTQQLISFRASHYVVELPLPKGHLGVSWHTLLCVVDKSKTQRAQITGQGHRTKEWQRGMGLCLLEP